MTEVPWMYTDAESEDIIYYASDNMELVYYYFEGFETIGVRSIYTTADGKKLYSEPTVYNVGPSSVAGIAAEKAVKSVETFDLAGRKVSADTKGFTLKRTVYADGTVKTEKTLVK